MAVFKDSNPNKVKVVSKAAEFGKRSIQIEIKPARSSTRKIYTKNISFFFNPLY
jgi:hypothetical protein